MTNEQLPTDSPEDSEDDELPHDNEPALHRAARLGDIDALARLLADGVSIDLRHPNSEEYGLTPLMTAARSLDGASAATIAWLLDHGADLHATSDGRTAAWFAAGKGGGNHWSDVHWSGKPWRLDPEQPERLRLLLDAGIDPLTTNVTGESLLAEAAWIGDPSRVRLLLERGVPATQIVNPDDPEYFTYRRNHVPLHAAARSGCAECVQLLLGAGALSESGSAGATNALYPAGSAEVVRVLVAAGADVVQTNPEARDVLEHVLDDGHEPPLGANLGLVASALLDAGAPLERAHSSESWPRLYTIAFQRSSYGVEWLLSNGASLAGPPGQNTTPMHIACWLGEHFPNRDDGPAEVIRIIDLLVAAGMSIDTRDGEGRTPLHKAIGGDACNRPVMVALLERGADPNAIDIYGQSPLHLASRGYADECIPALLAAGCDPLLPDIDGDTPLDLARAHRETLARIRHTPKSPEIAAFDAEVAKREGAATVAERDNRLDREADESVALLEAAAAKARRDG